MNIKLFSCLSIFGRKSLNNKTLFGCYKQCYLFSSSTKKNKKIVEKPNLELNISERLSKNEKFQDPKNKKELQINENENKPNTETLNIVQELKSKRYIYDENSQKVISLDLNKKEEKNPDYIIGICYKNIKPFMILNRKTTNSRRKNRKTVKIFESCRHLLKKRS